MNLLGIRLTLLLGPTVPVPAPPWLTAALESAEVTHSDGALSGFQLSFRAERSGPAGWLDYPTVRSPLLQPFNRVILIVTFNATPRLLMDGVITNQQLDPTGALYTVTGEDVSVMMDLEEKTEEHPAQNEAMIATRIIASYARYGLIPMVVPPPSMEMPLPAERVPVQRGSDLEYLEAIAARYAYVFYVTPGPAPGANTAYWGPPKRAGLPQRALTVDMGPNTNVESLNFTYGALDASLVEAEVQDRDTNQRMPVQTFASARPPLASRPALQALGAHVRRRKLNTAGLTASQAFARAQAFTEAAAGEVVTAEGELDALRYGEVLAARGLVGLRGAGASYDGAYYVKRVTHTIRRGSYKQRFTLAREGLGALLPVVRP